MFPSESVATYTNPVYDRSFPDPFVIKFRGDYFAYCTGLAPDGRVFGVLKSQDLVHWQELSGAMTPLEQPHPHYWAPEVTYFNGKFYLYYSVGNETLMEIRVAIAESPDGNFIDVGKRLTVQEFAIDPHVFRDDNGEWYMFYATDFLDHSHIGTGTVFDRMIDPFTLAGNPRPVTRARYDWQVYDPARKEKGGVRWHTVEGPFVLKRKGLYYEMFSGGNWQNETYGVSFAASESIERDDEWPQFSDGAKTLPVLRTIPDRIRGPGHNSVVTGPNNRELYCVYHLWTDAGRVLAVDRMDFAGPDRIFVSGPTDSPQPFPYPAEAMVGPGSNSEIWRVSSGEWDISSNLTSRDASRSDISYEMGIGRDLRCRLDCRAREKQGVFGIALKAGEIDLFVFAVDQETSTAHAEWAGSGGKRMLPLPADFAGTATHEVLFDIQGETVLLALDGSLAKVTADLPAKPTAISLFSEGTKVEFGPIEITAGFEELFQSGDILKRGWDHYGNSGALVLQNGLIKMEGSGENRATVTRNVQSGDHELCMNIRFQAIDPANSKLTFGCGSMFALAPGPASTLECEGITFSLPPGYEPGMFHQFRSVRRGNSVNIFLDADHLGTVRANGGEFVRIMAQDSVVELDMVRYTLI